MKRTIIAIALILAGCADSPAATPQAPEPSLSAGEPIVQVLFEGSAEWPRVPGQTLQLPFEVPANVTSLDVRFNWRGQQPGGFSSDRQAVIVAPDGKERAFTGADLPANPYACASSTCGPAQDRVERFEAPEPGMWRYELRGAYTATALYSVQATMGNATSGVAHDH